MVKIDVYSHTKESGAKGCNDYPIISLMSHLLKIFLKIIHRRIHKLCESQLDKTQFGFRDTLGTGDAFFAIQVSESRRQTRKTD